MSRALGLRAPIAAGLTCLALALAACGGDDEESSSAAAGEADTLVSCLQEAGLEAAVDDSGVTGVETQHTRIAVAVGDLDEGAVVVVFGAPDEAAFEFDAVDALAGVAGMELQGKVIYGFDSSAEQTPDDEAALEGCLP